MYISLQVSPEFIWNAVEFSNWRSKCYYGQPKPLPNVLRASLNSLWMRLHISSWNEDDFYIWQTFPRRRAAKCRMWLVKREPSRAHWTNFRIRVQSQMVAFHISCHLGFYRNCIYFSHFLTFGVDDVRCVHFGWIAVIELRFFGRGQGGRGGGVWASNEAMRVTTDKRAAHWLTR